MKIQIERDATEATGTELLDAYDRTGSEAPTQREALRAELLRRLDPKPSKPHPRPPVLPSMRRP